MIAIINYDMGNLQSVVNMLEYLNAPTIVTSDASEIRLAEKIILPGVGSFNQAMMNIEKLNLVPIIREEALKNKKPFLGICLGMQLMADKGYEGGECNGLSLIDGEVKPFDLTDKTLPIPHVGWNTVIPKESSVLFGKNNKEHVFYFVHSYHFVCKNENDVSGYSDYGGEFVASIEHDNIFATQFHPEKSQEDGIKLFKNFLSYNRN